MALLGRLSKLSFMNFYQTALERYMKTLLMIMHAMKLECTTVCDTKTYCGLSARYVPCNGVKTISQVADTNILFVLSFSSVSSAHQKLYQVVIRFRNKKEMLALSS